MIANWFHQAREFESELSCSDSIFPESCRGINCDADFEMEIDIEEDDETNAKKFRDYAAECRRLARTAAEADRVVLMEIAEAWIVVAEQAERNAGRNRKH